MAHPVLRRRHVSINWALCLIGVVLLAWSVPAGQTQSSLSPAEIEAAVQLGIDHKPAGYSLYREPEPAGAIVAFAYTPFVRVALAAYTMLHEKQIIPGPGDVAGAGRDGLIYIGLLDLTLVDNKPWIRDANVRHVVRMDLTPRFNRSAPLSYNGTPAVWAAWTTDAAADRKLDFELPLGTYVIGAFSREALADGGYVVAHVIATNRGGDEGTMINYAAVRRGQAATWR